MIKYILYYLLINPSFEKLQQIFNFLKAANLLQFWVEVVTNYRN